MSQIAAINEFRPENSNKEQVLRRLRKKVTELWGMQETEIDNLDPIVDLLLGACAVEFERTAQEINTSQSRVLERLAQLMVPEVLTNARPAHGIIHVRAELPKTILKTEDLFALEKETQEGSKIYKSSLFFSPVISMQAFDAAVVYQAAGGKIVTYDNPLAKGETIYGEGKELLDPFVLWIGIEANEGIRNFDGLTLYFDWKNNPDKARFLPLLSQATLYMNDKVVRTEAGLLKPFEEHLLVDFDAMAELEKNILQIYHSHFLTIFGKEVYPSKEAYPQEFENVFSKEKLSKLKPGLTWLKIKLPAGIPMQAVNDVYCSINSFPVMNRKLHTNHRPHALSSKLNSIPLPTEDTYFLTVRKVYSSGREYSPVSLKNIREVEDGCYALRQGGAERFDKRDAAAMLNNLYNMMRDESAAFASFGNTALFNEIRSMEQILTRLQMHLTQQITTQRPQAHLLIYTKDPEDVYVEFWSTQGELGNRIPSGKKAELLSHASLKKSHSVLLTTTTGGRAPMNESEKLYAYKYTLMTRSRIATEEDIKAACFAELGVRLSKVEVRKGVMKDLSVNKGFVKTLDIVLTPADNLPPTDWNMECRELCAMLERKKMFTVALRVFTINNQEQ